MSRHRTIELIASTALSPSVRSLVFRRIDGPVVYRPGQYVDLYVPTDSGISYKRRYSIASAPDPEDRSRFEVAVTRVEDGPTSVALHELVVGTRIQMDDAAGLFVRPAADTPSILVATGTGLAPLRAGLAEGLGNSRAPTILLFGCRTQSDILWGDELRRLSADHAHFRLEITLSRPFQGWTGRTGHVQAHVVELARTLASPRAYVCGLSKMVDDVVYLLETEGRLSPDRIHYEIYD